MDYIDRLHRLSINEADTVEANTALLAPVLDSRTLALLRLAALVAVGGAVPSYCAQADDALDEGASAAEIVDVLVAVLPIVGRPRVVAAAPKLAMALGYDTDALDQASE